MTKKFDNPKKQAFLASIPQTSVETSNIASRCKFNFSYFDPSQPDGQNFAEWNINNGSASLLSLLEKIKDYTKSPLAYWMNQRVGAGGLSVLAVYSSFPKGSSFRHPVHVPHDVSWARFRLGNKVRLIGFIIPEEYGDKVPKTNSGKEYRYDTNTFYVVFLDKNHLFYAVEAE